MAPLRLKDVTHEAVAPSLVLRVPQVEAPEHGYLPRVCRHRLDERPDEHEKEHVENSKHEYNSPIVCSDGDTLG